MADQYDISTSDILSQMDQEDFGLDAPKDSAQGNPFDSFDMDKDALTYPSQPGSNVFDDFDQDEPVKNVPFEGPNWFVNKAYRQISTDTEADRAAKKEAADQARGDGFLEGVVDPNQYAEFGKGIAPGAVRMTGTVPQGMAGIQTKVVHARHINNVRRLVLMDRLDAGEELPAKTLFDLELQAYRLMTPDMKATYRRNLTKEVEDFDPTALTDRSLFKFGAKIKEYADTIAPAKEGYEQAVGRQLGEGIGSLVAGLPAGWLGRVPALAFFGSGGAGEAVDRALAYSEAEKKEGRPGLTDDQIATAAVWGIAPGATDLLPVEVLLGRLKIPEPFRAPIARAIGRIGGQAFIEGMQEGGQAFLQNLISQQLYNDQQRLDEGILPEAGIGAGVGGIAAGTKEVARELIKSFGGRRPGADGAPASPQEEIRIAAEQIDQSQQITRAAKEDALRQEGASDDITAIDESLAPPVAPEASEPAQAAGPPGDTREPGGISEGRGLYPGAAQGADQFREDGEQREGQATEETSTPPPEASPIATDAQTEAEVDPIEDIRRWAKEQFGEDARVARWGRQYSISTGTEFLRDFHTPDGGVNIQQLTEMGYRPVEQAAAVNTAQQVAAALSDQVSEAEVQQVLAGNQASISRLVSRGLDDQQIQRVRDIVAQNSPDQVTQFDAIVAQMKEPAVAQELVDDVARAATQIQASPEQAETIAQAAAEDLSTKYGVPAGQKQFVSTAIQTALANPATATEVFTELASNFGFPVRLTAPVLATQIDTLPLRRNFASLLETKVPRKQWAEQLGVSEQELEPLIEEAIEKQWLRRDKNGRLLRRKREQRTGDIAGMIVADEMPSQMPGEGDVALTDPAQEQADRLRVAVDAAAEKILPDRVSVQVVEKIRIARRNREDELLAVGDYRGMHTAPHAGNGSPLYDVTLNGVYPDDFYSRQGLRYYGTGNRLDAETYQLITSLQNDPEALVTIYRAIPDNLPSDTEINPGDWVGITRGYVEDHGDAEFKDNYRIIERVVPAKELFTAGDSFLEWGWSPPVEDQMLALRAFHGSPHDFDRFDISRIGTGEGAQAFGHGLYFAENELTAKAYQRQLAGPERYQIDGKDLPESANIFALQNYARMKMDGNLSELKSERNRLEASIQDLQNELEANEYDNPFLREADELALRDSQSQLSDLDQIISGSVTRSQPGTLYEVEIDIEPEDLLDWDKPLGQQNDTMRAAIEKLPLDKSTKAAIRRGEELDVDLLWRGVRAKVKSETETATAFRKAGIPGIRFLDQGSRDAGEGSRNVVIFDDALVKITKKDGKPVTGKDREQIIDQMLALRGQQQVTETPEFKRWFGDSKVVDADGKPLVVYHGSLEAEVMDADFSFALGHQSTRSEEPSNAYYFSDSYNSAIDYADGARDQVASVYLNIENPLDLREKLAQEELFQALDPENRYGIDRNDGGDFSRIDDFYDDNGNKINPLPPIEPVGTFWDWAMQISHGDANVLINDIVNWAANTGYDGLIFLDGNRGDRSVSYAVFSPTQIKSTYNRGTFDPNDPRISYALRGFFSPAIRAAEKINQKKGTGEQFLKQITKVPGVRKDELEWMGLEDFLQDKKSITKDEVLDFMRAHQIELDEKILGEGQDVKAEVSGSSFQDFIDWIGDKSVRTDHINPDGQFRRVDMPDGRSAFVVPIPDADGTQRWAIFDNSRADINDSTSIDQAEHIAVASLRDFSKGTAFEDYKVPGGKNYREILIRLPELDTEYESPHFQDQEIVHLRVDDRIGPDGQKVLFINEVQSDLHQKGRKLGYNIENARAAQEAVRKMEAENAEFQAASRAWDLADNGLERVKQSEIIKRLRNEIVEPFGFKDANDVEDAVRAGIPNAPFKGDLWLELALKRALLYATEGGYDAISWARGDQIAKAVGGDAKALSVQYDQKIGRFLGKYTKKWNGKVDTVDIDDFDDSSIKARLRQSIQFAENSDLDGEIKSDLKEELESALSKSDGGMTDDTVYNSFSPLAKRVFNETWGENKGSQYLEITDKMRSSVQEGQPLALRGRKQTPQILTPEFKSWFGDSQIVDKSGRPLVVYHGTQADFEAFDPARIGQGDPGWLGAGFYFIARPDQTEEFGDITMPVYLKVENPFLVDEDSDVFLEQVRALEGGQDWLNRTETDTFPFGIVSLIMDKGSDEFSQLLKKAGYDGILLAGEDGAPSMRDEIVVFDPRQIKSAIGNRGAFDPTDPSIINAMGQQGPEALGQTDPYNMAISIAMRAVEAEAALKGVAPEQEAVRVLRHEAIEFFNSVGMFTPEEWSLLQKTAKRQGWIETTGVREAYSNLYRDGMSDADLNDLLIKEAIAEQYSEFHLKRKKFKGPIQRIFQRIKNFLSRVANAVQGYGFQKWEDVFEKVDRGEFKRRFDEAFADLAPTSIGAGVAAMQATAGRLVDSPVRRARAGTERPDQSLADLVGRFNDALGITSRQGRLDPGLTLRAGRVGASVRGQTSTLTGVVRMRVPNEIDTLAHEGGHVLENRFRGDLERLKQRHAATLEPLASPGPDALSEGFAEWFRRYVTNPTASMNVAPNFEAEFEQFLADRDPDMLAELHEIRDGYQAWVDAPSGGVVASSIVTSVPQGSVQEYVREFQQEGLRDTFFNWMDRTYTAVFDDLHPVKKTVDGLLDIAHHNLNIPDRERLGLKAADNPYKLLRMARDGYSGGHMDLLYGVHGYQEIEPRGSSFREALGVAFEGFEGSRWNEKISTDFGAYLVSRRFVQEWDRFQAGDLLAPPDKFSRADHMQSIQDFEAEYPGFAQAAPMVHDFLNQMLRKKRDAGLITDELYGELLQRKDYVPVMRDMSDQGSIEGAQSQRRDKFSVIKRFRGSQRDVINPLESIAKDAYETSMIIARNDAVRALDALARAAGPDGGRFAERIPAHEMRGTAVNVQEAIRAAARDAGIDAADMQIMLQAVDDQLGDNAIAQIWRAGDITEKGEAIIYLWENGERVPIRLADGQFGHDMLHAVSGLSREATGWFINLLSLPSTALRTGVTASLDFIGANFIRDQMAAWVLTEDFKPFYDGAKGIYNDLTMSDISRIYSRVGGIMGGANVAAAHESRIKREVLELRRRGIRLTLNPFTRDFWRMTEFSETGTRLSVFENGFNRARDDGLTDWEAALEASFVARDYIDFGRRGSRMLAARRLIPFFNAALQGLDREIRGMTGKAANEQIMREVISPYIRSRTGQPLNVVDRNRLGSSAKVWAYMTVLGMFGLGLSLLYQDDEEYEEISDYVRSTHWLFKVDGEWVRIPKPFFLAVFSNTLE